MPHPKAIHSGIAPLDRIVQHIRLGDNVVWQVDRLEDYREFARALADQALQEDRHLLYLRFASHPPILEPDGKWNMAVVDPRAGFESFSRTVHRIIERHGRGAYYIFDSLSALAQEWATDEMLANFFQATCPFLFEIDAVAYFALQRGKHAHEAVARIRDTTQLLIDLYLAEDERYLHPLKVWDRYAPDMFLPHRISGNQWKAVHHSAAAASAAAGGRGGPLARSRRSCAPWDTLCHQLEQYRDSPPAESDREVRALKREVIHMMIGAHPTVTSLAEDHLTLEDLLTIRDRLIGSGRIGGKAAGMLLARGVVTSATEQDELSTRLESHDSFYIGSDVFFTFLVRNDLFRLRMEMIQTAGISQEDYETVQARFLEGDFPDEIVDQFRAMLEHYGQAPIIVRSSSLLEDGFGNAFAGKYCSEFCVNQGSPEDRLEELLHRLKIVYASMLNPDALSYRRRRGLVESEEQMAILVQRVSGQRYKNAFFPCLAGVAFSRNLYAWTDRIDPARGIIRLVFGLGTRAVDRVGGDYPRMISVSHPELRPEVGEEVRLYSQHQVDVLNIETNRFDTVPISELLADRDYPHLEHFISIMRDGDLQDPVSSAISDAPSRFVLTFNRLIRRTPFVRDMGRMLSILEDAYGHPVDTEFTASLDSAGRLHINLLQCRPLWLPGTTGDIEFPRDIPADDTLFRSNRMVSGGIIADIRYILYIDPARYAAIKDPERQRALGRIVGRINRSPHVRDGRIIMMGPGRWGTGNLDLGIPVGFADIENASALVEIAHEAGGHTPEVSYGTHFFLDLVETDILYLPVYPDRDDSSFHQAFFRQAPNALGTLFPDLDDYADLVTLIDLRAGDSPATATIVADPETRQAICHLTRNGS